MLIHRRILWALSMIILINQPADGDPCTLTDLEKVDEYCTARIDCQHGFELDIQQWSCIKHTRSEQRYEYDHYGYSHRVSKVVTTYDENYNLMVYVKEPLETNSLLGREEHYVKLTLEDGSLPAVPEDVFKMTSLKELNIFGNDIANVNFNKFLSMSSLKQITLKNNNIRVIETDEQNVEAFARQLSTIQIIDVSNNLIEVLPNNFVSRFVQLQNLNLSHNIISSIGLLTFEGIVQLKTLDLSYNKLAEIGHALARFSNLKELYLSHNNITKLYAHNFITLLNLEKLDASSNGITTIENSTFQTLTKLQDLDLRHNNLLIIYNQLFDNNINLNYLYLTDNKIQSIEENSFKNTKLIKFCIQNNALSGVLRKNTFRGVNVLVLDLSGGNITTIEDEAFNDLAATYMPLLNNLNLSSNSISNLSFSAFSSLVSLDMLDLSHNKLKDFNMDSQSLINLTKLYLQHNYIETINKTVFEKFQSLKELDLSFNVLRNIQPGAFFRMNNILIFNIESSDFVSTFEKKMLDGLTSLTKIDMSRTKTMRFQNESFAGLLALIDVNYTSGQLAEIEYNAFLGVGYLEKLSLPHNQLRQFHVNTSTISRVQEIYLNNNFIRNISGDDFSHLTLLRILNLANNDIIKFNSDGFQHLYALTHLDLSSNTKMNIAGNPFVNLSKLYSLSLENVKWNISFENSSASIEILNLQSCGLSDVNKLYIFNVHGVSHLYLSMNKFTSIDKHSFGNMTTLVSLDLSLNKISFIQPGSFLYLKNLRSLNFFGNDLSSIQFGVFDGINVLRDLNFSSNVFSNFDVKILPKTERLYLDDNIINDINFKDFFDTDLSELSIGGNQISCKILAELKVSRYSEKFKQVITTKTLNYHSENVNGITCQTTGNVTPTANNERVSNNPSINIGPLITTLRNVLDKLSESIQTISANTLMSDELKNEEKQVIALLKNFVESNNNSDVTNYKYLAQLTEINNRSYEQLGEIKKYMIQLANNKNQFANVGESNTKSPIDDQYLRSEFQRMLKEENDALREEFKQALSSVSKGQPIQESLIAKEKDPDNTKPVIYFMAVCLAIMLSIYIGNIVFKQILSSRRSHGSHTRNSTTHIANSIEME